MAIGWIESAEAVSVSEWERVLGESPHRSPFVSPAFLLPWLKTFAADRPVRIARWEHDGAAAGFLFLCARDGGEPGWEIVGGNDVSDILDAVIVPGLEAPFWDDLLAGLRDLPGNGPLRLQSLPADSPTLDLLALKCPARGLSLRVEETDIAPRVALPGSFDAYVDALDKKARHELRRKIRRAEEALPGLAFRVCSAVADVDASIGSFLELHRKSHPEKAAFMTGEMAGFFRDIAHGFAGRGLLRLAFLSDSAGDVASAFQLVAGDRLLLYNSGFDPARREANPGLVLIARGIEAAISEGFREYDFLRGTERYKYDLGGRDRAVFRATVSSRDAR